MSPQELLVQRYMDGFQRSDHPAILSCLTDDVVWRIFGSRTTQGKAAFDKEIETPGFEGSTDYSVERTLSAGDTTIITGTGHGRHVTTGPFQFAFSDVFTFRDGLISQVDSYVVPLP